MVLITENGWPQINASQLNRDRLVLDNGRSIPAETVGGDGGVVLRAFYRWLDRNVQTGDRGGRDDWFWSATNDVWNSNHLSGTAFDKDASQWPWTQYNMPKEMVSKIREGIRLFEGTMFWGRDWSRPDEMHFQLNGSAAKIAPFAKRLREGYLGLLEGAKPADPLAWPLAAGYYFGPLDGPAESISGLYETDSKWAKDHLGLWQDRAGIKVTQTWTQQTADAVKALQKERGWDFPTNPFLGVIYIGEWDAVVRGLWKYKLTPPAVSPVTTPPAQPAPTPPSVIDVTLQAGQTARIRRA